MTTLFRAYLSLIEDIGVINSKHGLQLNEVALLDAIDIQLQKDPILSVGETISWESIASPATLHCTLKKLLSKKMLVLKTSSEDGRKKFIELGTNGALRQKQINQVMSKLSKSL